MYDWLTVFAYIDSTQDDEDGSDNDSLQPTATSKLITLAEQLEAGYISQVGAGSSPELLHHLCAFWAELHREQLRNAKQTVLGSHGFVKIP